MYFYWPAICTGSLACGYLDFSCFISQVHIQWINCITYIINLSYILIVTFISNEPNEWLANSYTLINRNETHTNKRTLWNDKQSNMNRSVGWDMTWQNENINMSLVWRFVHVCACNTRERFGMENSFFLFFFSLSADCYC